MDLMEGAQPGFYQGTSPLDTSNIPHRKGAQALEQAAKEVGSPQEKLDVALRFG